MQQPTQVGGERQQPLVTRQHQLQQQSTQSQEQHQPQQEGAQQHQQCQPQVVIQTVPSGFAPNRATRQIRDQSLFPRTKVAKAIVWCSIIQLICAILAVTLDAGSIALSSSIYVSKTSSHEQEWDKSVFPDDVATGIDGNRSQYSILSRRARSISDPARHYYGSGIWAGCFAIVTASFGIAAGKLKRNKCLSIIQIVLSIITAPLMTGIITSTGLVLTDLERCYRCRPYIRRRYINVPDYTYACNETVRSVVRSLQVTVLLCGIIIALISIISASLCCKACGCCSSRSTNRNNQYRGPPQQYAVVYQPHPGAGRYPQPGVGGYPQPGVGGYLQPGVGGYPQPGVGGYLQPVVSGYPQNMMVVGQPTRAFGAPE